MSSNTTSTDTGVPPSTSTTPSSSQAASTPTSSSVQSSSSSIANSSPTSIASSSEISSSTSQSSSTPVSISSSSTSESSTSTTPISTTSSRSDTTTTPSSTSSIPTTSSSQTVPTTSASSTPPSVTTATLTSSNESTTITIVQTSTEVGGIASNTGTGTSSISPTATPGLQTSGKSTSSGLNGGGKIAVAVVVPIVAVALLVLAGLYFWRKRKQRKDAEELRRKEVEEYGYNPNNDPTLPSVGAVGAVGSPDGAYEMREDGSSGYRGWGTTAVASSGRKASTTISGGQSPGAIGMAYSEGTSPTHGPVSDTRSDNPLVDGRPLSGEAESLGAMGPAASGNRSEINRGPSNASSSYSAANRSDGSGEGPGSFTAGQYYNGNNQYDAGNPYSPETQYGSPPGRTEMPAQPVIRDVQARRNTRIENPAHFPQQSAGISQNF